jgi:hypothetical protein
MRIACLMMAHKEPAQIERLLKRFDHPFVDFYIHLDKKTNLKDFAYLGERKGVYFITKRSKVRWASYSFVKAVIISFKQILNSGKHYDFISLMSGQDYPIKPVPLIFSYLEQQKGKNFISFEESDAPWWSHAINRIKKYHFTNYDFRGKYRMQYIINRILPDRKFPLPYTLYGGPRAMCMTLTTDCAAYVVDFIGSNRKLRIFSNFTWGTDEFLIPTIIMNSPFSKSVVNNNFYYIDWSKGGSNPKILTIDDYESIANSDKFLARKFDIREDSKILDLIDTMAAT